jgi:hypothetical protein
MRGEAERKSKPALAWALILAGAFSAATASAQTPRVLDSFDDATAWSAHPAEGVELALSADAPPGAHGKALRLDVNFTRGSGYAVARRALDVELPANYRFRFRVRGDVPPNALEFKLIDESGENVWWSNQRDFAFGPEWRDVALKKRHITFAWGPVGGGEIRHVKSLEVAITAGKGGKGSVWLDDLTLEELPAAGALPPPPVARATTADKDGDAARALDGDAQTAWRAKANDKAPALTLDLGVEREFGGLALQWVEGARPKTFFRETSADGRHWALARVVRSTFDARRINDDFALPESEARFVRVRATEGPMALAEVRLEPLAFGAPASERVKAIAARAPRGVYPRGFVGEQSYWTVVGVPGDTAEALLGEDGTLEIGKAEGSIEPFLWFDGKLHGWADGTARQELESGELPLPRVVRTHGDIELSVAAVPQGMPGDARVVVRYVVTNRGAAAKPVSLQLALRPFQVNPPTQFLNQPGGTARLHHLREDEKVLVWNEDRLIRLYTSSWRFATVRGDDGDVVEDFLAQGHFPRGSVLVDSTGEGGGVIAWDFSLQPGGSFDAGLFVQLQPGHLAPGAFPWPLSVDEAFANATRGAANMLGWGPKFEIPAAKELLETMRAQVGWIDVNRDGPAIQPGSRSYERSWIRDGALTSSALLRMGREDTVKDFARWYARFLYDDGKVPCCVDARGPDPVPEHDSHGEFIALVAETYRYSGDRAFADSLWPSVEKAAAYLEKLRQERRTDEWRTPERAPFFGLLPPSISHEGYSAKPMHSYWDDFFALRGFKDAAFLAGELGHADAKRRWTASRVEFEHDLRASIVAAMKAHAIDYVPGCADLGDFDATSTTIALAPAQADTVLPKGALEQTFERYWKNFDDRRTGRLAWDAFTPYEVRNIGAFVRLGWRDRAQEAIAWFLDERRPAGWRQWPEVVDSLERRPRFLGDLPHTWVGSDFVRSALDLFAYDRERDDALVVAAGVPWTWVEHGGVSAEALRTPFGAVNLALTARAGARPGLTARLGGALRIPRGGIVLAPPAPANAPWRAVRVNGRPATLRAGGQVVVRALPATVEFSP